MFRDTLIGRAYADFEMELIDIEFDIKNGKIDLMTQKIPTEFINRLLDEMDESWYDQLIYNRDFL